MTAAVNVALGALTWTLPAALLGLASLPVLWWLHRRRRRPPVLPLPSLMFLVDEDEVRSLPRGRRLDLELVLAMAAVLLLVLAAAGPLLDAGRAGRVVRVVRLGCGSTGRYRAEADRAVAALREALPASDTLQVVEEPRSTPWAAPRPTEEALLAAARAGEAGVRVVVSDRLPAAEPGDVTWVAVGDPEARNVGIVAVSVRPRGDELELFANVVNDAADAAAVRVSVHDGRKLQRVELDLAAWQARSLLVPLPANTQGISVMLDVSDALPWDDGVSLTREVPVVYVDVDLPAPLGERVRQAIAAALGEGGARLVGPQDVREARFAFVRRGWRPPHDKLTILELQAAPEGAALERPGVGSDEVGLGVLARDLSAAGTDWVFPAGAREPGPGEEILLARRADGLWPILLQAGERLRLAPDPLRGEPPPVDVPFWPVLIENVLTRGRGHREVGAGFSADGLLDPPTSRLGRDVRAPEVAALTAAAGANEADGRPLRPYLVACALACLLGLWLLPRIRRRRPRTGRRLAQHTA